MPSVGISKVDEQFQAEDDVRTLVNVAKLKKDKKRMDRAMKEARSQMKALEDVDR